MYVPNRQLGGGISDNHRRRDQFQKQANVALRIMTSFAQYVFYLLSGLFNFFLLYFHKTTRAYCKYQVVKYYSNIPMSPLTTHRLLSVKRKILVLDLDETLIHSHHDGVLRQTVKPGTPSDFTIRVVIDRHPVKFSVHERPHVDYFLSTVSQRYELVVFTASMEVYGSSVADKLDRGRGILKRRYFRQHCTIEVGGYTKDLSAIHSDLSSICILDKSSDMIRCISLKTKRSDPFSPATCYLAKLSNGNSVPSLQNLAIQKELQFPFFIINKMESDGVKDVWVSVKENIKMNILSLRGKVAKLGLTEQQSFIRSFLFDNVGSSLEEWNCHLMKKVDAINETYKNCGVLVEKSVNPRKAFHHQRFTSKPLNGSSSVEKHPLGIETSPIPPRVEDALKVLCHMHNTLELLLIHLESTVYKNDDEGDFHYYLILPFSSEASTEIFRSWTTSNTALHCDVVVYTVDAF